LKNLKQIQGKLIMANPNTSVSSFLKEALTSYSSYTSTAKQTAQKYALSWLQSQIESELEDQTIMEQFTQKWRTGTNKSVSGDNSPLYFEKLPGSYKKTHSISNHQEDALVFIHEKVPPEMQESFKERWNLKTKLDVSNASGTPFTIDERELSILQSEDPEGNGITWYQVETKQMYYLLAFEEQDNQYKIVLSDKISPQKHDVWFVDKEDVKISDI
jgi:hypothetical protein